MNKIPIPLEYIETVKQAIVDGCNNNDKFFYKDLIKALSLPEKDMNVMGTLHYIVNTYLSDEIESKQGPMGGFSLKNSPRALKSEKDEAILISQMEEFLSNFAAITISCKDIAKKLDLDPYDGQLRVNKLLKNSKITGWSVKRGRGAFRISAFRN